MFPTRIKEPTFGPKVGRFYPNVKKLNAVLRYLRSAVPGLPQVCNSPRYLRWATAGIELTAVLRAGAASAKLNAVWATTSTLQYLKFLSHI